MLFFHIPIYELSLAYDQYLINPSVGSGFIKEPLSLQEENVGLFDKIVLLQSSKFIAFGHDHVNTLQIKFNDVMFCVICDNKISATLEILTIWQKKG